eukprot:6189046-Pleurochrysis_carterae.AAC.3
MLQLILSTLQHRLPLCNSATRAYALCAPSFIMQAGKQKQQTGLAACQAELKQLSSARSARTASSSPEFLTLNDSWSSLRRAAPVH